MEIGEDGLGTLDMTWDDEQGEITMLSSELLHDSGEQGFLAIVRAGEQDDTMLICDACPMHHGAELGDLGFIRSRALGVKFDAASVVEPLWGHTEGGETSDISELLDEHLIEHGEDGPHEESELVKAAFGFGGESGIYHADADALATSGGDEIGPDFGLDENDLRRADEIKETLADQGQIDRRVEDHDTPTLFECEFICHGVTRRCGRGQDDAGLRRFSKQPSDQLDGDSHLSHAHRMNP